MFPPKADVVVIGAGVTGASIAYHLSKRKLDVVVFEKGDFVSGSSGACGGTIFLQTKNPGIHLKLAMQSAQKFHHLEEELDSQFEYRKKGGMIVIENENQLPAIQQMVEKQNQFGLDVSLLEKRQALELEPALGKNILGATFSPSDAELNPLLLTFALLTAAEKRGAKVISNVKVTGIGKASHRVRSVKTEKAEIETNIIINAAGAHAAEIGKMVGVEIPVKPRRGQLVVTEAVEPMISRCLLSAQYIAAKFNSKIAAHGGGVSIEQTLRGNFILGSTREFVGFDKRTTQEGLLYISKHVARIMPWIKNLHVVRTFAGLRPYTPDGLPILGTVTGLDGFVMAAGHEGDGIAIAPITGEIIADLIVDNKTGMYLEEYRLERFYS